MTVRGILSLKNFSKLVPFWFITGQDIFYINRLALSLAILRMLCSIEV